MTRRFVPWLAITCAIGSRPVAGASSACTGVGAALDSDLAALATSSMMLLPTSNILSRSDGPPGPPVTLAQFERAARFSKSGGGGEYRAEDRGVLGGGGCNHERMPNCVLKA